MGLTKNELQLRTCVTVGNESHLNKNGSPLKKLVAEKMCCSWKNTSRLKKLFNSLKTGLHSKKVCHTWKNGLHLKKCVIVRTVNRP